MVLHSPILSGMRVLTESRALSCLDIYPNVDRASRLSCPVMVMHGMRDEEVCQRFCTSGACDMTYFGSDAVIFTGGY